MLNITSLSAYYGELQALKNVSLHVDAGEVVCILGANGAGKTTLLNTLMGLVRRREGCISFEGADITRLYTPAVIARGIAQVPEGRQLCPAMTVLDNLLLGAFLNRRDARRVALAQDRMYTYFPILRERRHQLAGSLSGGEQQMLAIARALMSEPRLILLDEPSLGLAPKVVDDIYAIIRALKNENRTIVIVEQNAAVALRVADRGYVLENGRIILAETAEELGRNKEVVRAYLGKEEKGIWEL